MPYEAASNSQVHCSQHCKDLERNCKRWVCGFCGDNVSEAHECPVLEAHIKRKEMVI